MSAIDEQFLEACKACSASKISKFLTEGANINARDSNGNNGLHLISRFRLDDYTAKENYEKASRHFGRMIKFLLVKGINYKATNKHDLTPLAFCNEYATDNKRIMRTVIEDFDFENQQSSKRLLTAQTKLLETINQKVDKQNIVIIEIFKKLQQPLNSQLQFEVEKLQSENKLLTEMLNNFQQPLASQQQTEALAKDTPFFAKQKRLPLKAEELQQEGNKLHVLPAANSQDTTTKASTSQILK